MSDSFSGFDHVLVAWILRCQRLLLLLLCLEVLLYILLNIGVVRHFAIGWLVVSLVVLCLDRCRLHISLSHTLCFLLLRDFFEIYFGRTCLFLRRFDLQLEVLLVFFLRHSLVGTALLLLALMHLCALLLDLLEAHDVLVHVLEGGWLIFLRWRRVGVLASEFGVVERTFRAHRGLEVLALVTIDEDVLRVIDPSGALLDDVGVSRTGLAVLSCWLVGTAAVLVCLLLYEEGLAGALRDLRLAIDFL